MNVVLLRSVVLGAVLALAGGMPPSCGSSVRPRDSRTGGVVGTHARPQHIAARVEKEELDQVRQPLAERLEEIRTLVEQVRAGPAAARRDEQAAAHYAKAALVLTHIEQLELRTYWAASIRRQLPMLW